jgi:hypothetical protein
VRQNDSNVQGPARLSFEALSVFLGSDDHLNGLVLAAPAVSVG